MMVAADPVAATHDFSFAVTFVLCYFVPGAVASIRHHHQTAAIWVLNVLLGWTVIGWIVALVWASTAVRMRPEPLA